MALLMTTLLGQMRQEMTLLGILDPNERAFFLAMASQECPSTGQHEYATTLAEVSHNVFGVRWYAELDQGRYPEVVVPGNRYDRAGEGLSRVSMRAYPSLRECIRIERINKIQRPQMYAKCKAAYGNGYPTAGARPDWPSWIRCMMQIHCSTNPQHADDVLTKWRELKILEARA